MRRNLLSPIKYRLQAFLLSNNPTRITIVNVVELATLLLVAYVLKCTHRASRLVSNPTAFTILNKLHMVFKKLGDFACSSLLKMARSRKQVVVQRSVL